MDNTEDIKLTLDFINRLPEESRKIVKDHISNMVTIENTRLPESEITGYAESLTKMLGNKEKVIVKLTSEVGSTETDTEKQSDCTYSEVYPDIQDNPNKNYGVLEVYPDIQDNSNKNYGFLDVIANSLNIPGTSYLKFMDFLIKNKIIMVGSIVSYNQEVTSYIKDQKEKLNKTKLEKENIVTEISKLESKIEELKSDLNKLKSNNKSIL